MFNSKSLVIASVVISFSVGFFLGKSRQGDSSKVDPETVYVTFNGGVIKAGEVTGSVDAELSLYPSKIYNLKKQIAVDLARSRIFEIEAAKRKIKVADLADDLFKDYKNEKISNEALNTYIKNQGLDVRKISNQDRIGLEIAFRREKEMYYQRHAVDELVKSANIKIIIPEPKEIKK